MADMNTTDMPLPDPVERLAARQAALQVELARLAELAPAALPDKAALARALPPEQASHLARLQAAHAALALAADLLAAAAPAAAAALQRPLAAVDRQVKQWRGTGRGWFEDRMVSRPYIQLAQTPDGRLEIVGVEWVAFGPYRYFRWREAGRMRTYYLGRVDKIEDEEDEEDAVFAEQAATEGTPAQGTDTTPPAVAGPPRLSFAQLKRDSRVSAWIAACSYRHTAQMRLAREQRRPGGGDPQKIATLQTRVQHWEAEERACYQALPYYEPMPGRTRKDWQPVAQSSG